MPKDFEVSRLLDIYGGLLPEKQRLLVELYYNDDLSLSEISENEGITRQGVRDSLKRAEAQLRLYESELHLAETVRALRKARAEADDKALYEIIDNL
ncbi:MAG: DNA-binding protein [Clostridia bacterium]|nr:DNA-binding protein [Oscillospiraceae bacterium]MBR6694457.1 DNA-binding protein [Clostridia bacterium]